MLVMFERRIALQDRAAAVLSLLTQAEREHVISSTDASRLKLNVSRAVAWISMPNGKWPPRESSDSSTSSFLALSVPSMRPGSSPSQHTNLNKNLNRNSHDEEASQEETLGALVEIESEVPKRDQQSKLGIDRDSRRLGRLPEVLRSRF